MSTSPTRPAPVGATASSSGPDRGPDRRDGGADGHLARALAAFARPFEGADARDGGRWPAIARRAGSALAPPRRRLVVALTVAVAAVVVGAVAGLRPGARRPGEGPAATAPVAAAPAPHPPATAPPGGSADPREEGVGPPATDGPADVYAHAAGAVVAPGLYRLRGPARVSDLVRAAGGFRLDADPDRVNLAAPVPDGARVYVPRRGEAGAGPAVSGPDGGASVSAPPTAPQGPVNLNTAGEAELETLPGIGPATAAAIVRRRTEHGPFTSIDQLGEVRGIGPARLAALRGRVVL